MAWVGRGARKAVASDLVQVEVEVSQTQCHLCQQKLGTAKLVRSHLQNWSSSSQQPWKSFNCLLLTVGTADNLPGWETAWLFAKDNSECKRQKIETKATGLGSPWCQSAAIWLCWVDFEANWRVEANLKPLFSSFQHIHNCLKSYLDLLHAIPFSSTSPCSLWELEGQSFNVVAIPPRSIHCQAVGDLNLVCNRPSNILSTHRSNSFCTLHTPIAQLVVVKETLIKSCSSRAQCKMCETRWMENGPSLPVTLWVVSTNIVHTHLLNPACPKRLRGVRSTFLFVFSLLCCHGNVVAWPGRSPAQEAERFIFCNTAIVVWASGAGRHKDWSRDEGGGVHCHWYCGNPRYLQLVSAHCLLFPTAFVLDTHHSPLIASPQCRRDLFWAKTVAWWEKPVWASACKYVRNRLVGKPPSGQTGPNRSQRAASTPCPVCVLRQNAQLSDSDTCRNKVVTRVQLFGHFCQIGGRLNFGTRHNVLTFRAVIF